MLYLIYGIICIFHLPLDIPHCPVGVFVYVIICYVYARAFIVLCICIYVFSYMYTNKLYYSIIDLF